MEGDLNFIKHKSSQPHSLAELRESFRIAGEWECLTCQLCGLITVFGTIQLQNSRRVGSIRLASCVVSSLCLELFKRVQNLIKFGDDEGSTPSILRFINFGTAVPEWR
jgi:Fe-S-cluster-containing hydrogenase component 2